MTQLLHWYCGVEATAMTVPGCAEGQQGFMACFPLVVTIAMPYFMRSMLRVRWHFCTATAVFTAASYAASAASILDSDVVGVAATLAFNAAFSMATNWLSERSDRTGFWYVGMPPSSLLTAALNPACGGRAGTTWRLAPWPASRGRNR